LCHTRWATHGEPTDVNAHPHTDQHHRLALVHNGVIENYASLKKKLIAKGHTFQSQTDTEVLAHLIGDWHDQLTTVDPAQRLEEAVKSALREVHGTYGIVVLHHDYPGLLVGARRGSPLVLGIGKNEHFIASDVAAVAAHTQKAVYLNDFEVVTIANGDFRISSLTGETVDFTVSKVELAEASAELGDFPHFMLKEIFEQPQAIENGFRGRLSAEDGTARLGGLNMTPQELREIDRVLIVACGTALHAGRVAEYAIESLAQIPVECDFASEFRYRNCPMDKRTLVFVVSQSGETADTLGALREAQRKGFRVLGIVNKVGSTIARESDGGVYLHAGPEVGVAATKSFTSQVLIFNLLALILGRMRHLSTSRGKEIVEAINRLPKQIETILEQTNHIKRIAEKYKDAKSMLFMGRQFQSPVALEGALKMKEITYIHAEGYPSAELKHGVIALVDEHTPTVYLCPKDSLYDKNISNLQEVKARRGPVIAIASEGDEDIKSMADDVIYIPDTLESLMPILTSIPLQLLSYHTAVALGRDVDKPRNLAKSVTVE
jgi:glucosamine--fructose-6-phosphate aminotransferase (isomerizing)